MASVFLSYDHEDMERAAPIAAALENAGHSVWWDRQIHGGAEYNSEIEGAVAAADVVVVLWTERSVRSAWVRDEAAEGRDLGKLVPVALDRTKPPMGFRQFQTIDLRGWKGRGPPPQMSELQHAIETIAGSAPATKPAAASAPSRLRRPKVPLAWAGAVAMLLIIIGLLFARPWERKAAVPVVTVVPSDDSANSRTVAGNLLVQLGSLEASNAASLQLVEPQSMAKADLTFKVGTIAGTGDPRANLSLVDNRAGAVLWAREFVQPSGNEADLRQQLAYSAGNVLRCATEALSPEHREIKIPTLKEMGAPIFRTCLRTTHKQQFPISERSPSRRPVSPGAGPNCSSPKQWR